MAVWDRITSRGDVEDRRSNGPLALGGVGLTGVVLYVAFTLLSGGNVSDVLNQIGQQVIENQRSLSAEDFNGQDDYEVFASTVLGSTNDTWSAIFNQRNRSYDPPKLVLFRAATQSGCGLATSQVGPHYCPVDETIYLDETFFDELTSRFGAQGGDVAQAYVMAHEVGHHVQNQLGTMNQVQQVERSNPDEANNESIKLELQADCFAGVWANSIKDLDVFLPGEINEAIDAAESVGDDRIQQRVEGQVNPETWTHGSSAQRVQWFNRGFEDGSVDVCNTFQ